MNRTDFQELADVRAAEAEVLFAQGMFEGAYYLAGYAVECALKSCIAKLTNQHDFPPDRQFTQDCYTHDIEKLVTSAGLKQSRQDAIDADPNFASNWVIVKDWNESARYERKTQVEADALINAIIDPAHGVLQWLKQRW